MQRFLWLYQIKDDRKLAILMRLECHEWACRQMMFPRNAFSILKLAKFGKRTLNSKSEMCSFKSDQKTHLLIRRAGHL